MADAINTIQNTASPWTAAISPAVQGGFGIIGSGLNYYFNKKLAEQQNEYNLQMWNLQNEYNSPAAQMKRLEDAGLNTALMYGQGSTGNAAHAPEMVTPQAPRIDRDLVELSKAFNIEGLRKVVAERKSAEAKARIDETAADREEMQFDADKELGATYEYDPVTGRFVPLSVAPGWYGIENLKASNFYKMQRLAENFRTNSLLYPRSLLIGESLNLTKKRAELLAPQILMNQFDADWYKQFGYWSGPAINILKALLSVIRKK